MGFFSDFYSEFFKNYKPSGSGSDISEHEKLMEKLKMGQKMSGNIVIPEGTEEIPSRMFDGNSKITSVMIPGTVKKIGERAFAECDNLEKVTLCEGIESIGSNAFIGCHKLRRVTYPDSVKEYQGGTFYDTKLEAPVMNVSQTILVFCPESVSGREWTVPDTVKIIAWQAFYGHKELEIIHLPEGLEKIKSMAFIKCGIREITIPYSVKAIEKEAFWNCTALESVKILNPKTRVACAAFGGCVNLKRIDCADSFETDKLCHLKGQSFLVQHIEDAANLRHRSNPTFKQLTAQCAKGDSDAMYALSEWFGKQAEKRRASPFYRRAANYWRYRAYQNGNVDAHRWFRQFFAEHPGKQLESVLCENNDHDANWYRFDLSGSILNDLGYDFFDPKKHYDVKWFEENEVVEVGTFESYEGPDEDGYGAETYYDWWFLDKNMQPIPNVKKVNASFSERRTLSQFEKEKEKAEELLKQSKQTF